MDHAFPFYPRYSDTEDIEPSFSDIFLSMVDNINPQDYDSSFSSSLALYSSSSYSLPIPSDDPQYSEINYLWQPEHLSSSDQLKHYLCWCITAVSLIIAHFLSTKKNSFKNKIYIYSHFDRIPIIKLYNTSQCCTGIHWTTIGTLAGSWSPICRAQTAFSFWSVEASRGSFRVV